MVRIPYGTNATASRIDAPRLKISKPSGPPNGLASRSIPLGAAAAAGLATSRDGFIIPFGDKPPFAKHPCGAAVSAT